MNDVHLSADELVDYLHGELPVSRDAAVAMHLVQCRTCAEARDAEVSLIEMVRAVAQTQERPVPSAVMSSIRAAAARQGRAAPGRAWYLGPLVALPVAVAAGVLIWFGIRPGALNQPKTAIAAGYFVNRHAMFSPITPFADDAPIPAAFTSDDASH